MFLVMSWFIWMNRIMVSTTFTWLHSPVEHVLTVQFIQEVLKLCYVAAWDYTQWTNLCTTYWKENWLLEHFKFSHTLYLLRRSPAVLLDMVGKAQSWKCILEHGPNHVVKGTSDLRDRIVESQKVSAALTIPP